MAKSPESRFWRNAIVQTAKKNRAKIDGHSFEELVALEWTIRYALSTDDPYEGVDYVISLLADLDDYETYSSNRPECLAANALQAKCTRRWYFVHYDEIRVVAKDICCELIEDGVTYD